MRYEIQKDGDAFDATGTIEQGGRLYHMWRTMYPKAHIALIDTQTGETMYETDNKGE
tara:strand:+ start:1214 stop:1384 length:171 start_codon:yes stop_codon:yes gene_type:complete